jgi:hypothetical protein
MPRDHEARLFHMLVLMGIGLTGTAVVPALAGCGGNVATETKAGDAGPDGPYATIGYVSPDASDASYATIGIVQADAMYETIHPAPPADAGDASYATIGYLDAGDDAYVIILPAPPPDAGTDGCYPCISIGPEPDSGP